jgi:diguanylate cyclase (GGDEF)-like protein
MPRRDATYGLVLVMIILTVFSVTVAVTNSRGTTRAQAAAAESDLFEQAVAALSAQEESAEDVVAEGAAGDVAETRRAYTAAARDARAALEDLHLVAEASLSPAELDALLTTHERYAGAERAMFDVAATEGPDAAADYEETFVDPYFDPLSASLTRLLRERYLGARDALASIAQTQALLQVVTPALFGLGLVLLASFSVLLSRSRRMVVAQADENRHQSLHDSLTGLPNRKRLHELGAACLEQSARTGTPTALMLLDLDRFKEINDTLGHHHGDLVLQAVADRLSTAVRSADVVARLGGDEFALLLPDISDAPAALAVASRVEESLRSSLDIRGILLDVDISMGIALSGTHGDDMSTLLQHADIAMYRAKDDDLGVCLYDDELNEHSRDQLGLLGELRRAIDNDELVLHYQPKVSLPDGRFRGAEALLRWQHPTRGLLPPGTFVPAAERTALIRPLTAWVLEAALAECKRWHDEGQPLRLAVNVSARNLLDASFGDDVIDTINRWDLPASCLLLEVTESAIMVDPARAEAILRQFTLHGIDIAIDDFGAGYTSLAHLRALPVHELKIDMALVRQMTVSDADTLIVRTIIDLAHGLGLRTVAEGVEDTDTLSRLSALGCDIAQGFHIARPMPATDLRVWVRRALSTPPRPRAWTT